MKVFNGMHYFYKQSQIPPRRTAASCALDDVASFWVVRGGDLRPR
jgi:hypothetical protein